MEGSRTIGFLAGLCVLVSSSISLAADEATVKAAYVYNFAKFVQWPDEKSSTLRLCDLGHDPLDKFLDILIGKPVRNMQISVRHAVGLQDVPQCDLIYIPAGYAQTLERVRQVVNDYPILIVTESATTLPKGGMVALIQSDGRIVFEVDLGLARQLGLQISGKMLQLARKVY